jgi:hypothetical protein
MNIVNKVLCLQNVLILFSEPSSNPVLFHLDSKEITYTDGIQHQGEAADIGLWI